jgi:hypothetical protein
VELSFGKIHGQYIEAGFWNYPGNQTEYIRKGSFGSAVDSLQVGLIHYKNGVFLSIRSEKLLKFDDSSYQDMLLLIALILSPIFSLPPYITRCY